MKLRKPLCCLALGALALAASAAVLVTTLRSQDFTASAQAQDAASIQLDMNPDNGSGPCNPIDESVTVGEGSEYKVAVCLTGADSVPNSFEAHIDHKDSIDQCVPLDCSDKNCLDGNPDANAGSTTFSTPSLGDGWDCDVAGVSPASCKSNSGQISIACISAVNLGTLPVGPGVSSPVALIHFKAASQGTDQLSIFSATAADWDTATILDCRSSSGSCRGGTVVVGPPGAESPTPVETAVPGATSPPVGPVEATATAAAAASAATASAGAVATAVAQGTPIAAINQAATATAAAATKAAVATEATVQATSTAKPSATQQKSGGSSGPNAGLIAGIVVAVLVVGGGAGWFTFRKLRSR